ncbi:DUF6705 family protein [Flavobacterium facile]|uniref:DUF6705 family protein n=1 Tax=Flavobacterium facile TaxID=2893174 RepID=UPI002E769E60|nr:DUF6705 family protein [Flavobacterium sp. T-12]
MKYLIKLIACLLITLNANCQVTTTVPISSYDYPNGAYLKDFNDELTYWEGTWEGTINNKKYTFVFTKFIQHLKGDANSHYYYRDEILGKYKVVDLTTNQILYDNLFATNYDDYLILGLAIRNGDFIFNFEDVASKCYNSIEFHLQKINGQTNQVKYGYFRFLDYQNWDCTNYSNQASIPMFLPQQELILTKQ